MVVPTPNPSTTPVTLTPAQTRALLHTLLSTDLNAPRVNSTTLRAPAIKPVRQQPIQQTIIVDASSRIMGHCNNVNLASPSPAEQAVKIEELLHGILEPAAPGEEKTKVRAKVNLNVNIQAGVSIIGSKNVVVFSGLRDVSKDSTKGDERFAGRKRRAESEPADVQTTLGKKVKAEA